MMKCEQASGGSGAITSFFTRSPPLSPRPPFLCATFHNGLWLPMEREGGRGRGGWNSICVTEDLYHSIPPSIFLVFCDRLTRFRSRHLIGHLARPTPTLDFRWKGLKGHSALIQSFARHCTHFFRSSCLFAYALRSSGHPVML